MLKRCDFSIDDKVLVVEPLFAGAVRFSEKPQMIRWIMGAMFDPAVHEDGALAEHEAVDRRYAAFIGREKQRGYFIAQRGREPLVGVEVEQPIGF